MCQRCFEVNLNLQVNTFLFVSLHCCFLNVTYILIHICIHTIGFTSGVFRVFPLPAGEVL